MTETETTVYRHYANGEPDTRPRYAANPEPPETYTGETRAPETHLCKIGCAAHLN
jgi:hypothetical protein